MKCRENFDTVF